MNKLDQIEDYIILLVRQLSVEYDLKPSEVNNERYILSKEIYKEIMDIIKEDK